MPRDAARDAAPRTGTAVIRGKVTDQETGQPIPRAIVMVTSAALMQQTQGRGLSVTASADGQYELKNLPAGEYTITARPGESRATHLNQTYGETRPPDFSRPRRPRPVALGDGEVRENANIALWRTAAVEGRVVDEFGEPMAGVEVFARNPENAQRAGMSGPFPAMTDDRGLFRVFGIAPGRYHICANPRNVGGPAAPDLKDRAIQTCHPAAVIDAEAAVVTVSSGDVAGIEIRLQRSRAFNVSGMALDSNGSPLERANISIVSIDRPGGASSTGTEMRPGGQFIARGLTPGDYAIRAEIGSRFNPEDKREREFGYVPFRIESSDVEGLLVTTSKSATVSGRVIFEDEAADRPSSTMRVSAMPDMSNRVYMSIGPPPNAEVKSDLTFELTGLFGPQVINFIAPRDWVVKAVKFKGQDITDTHRFHRQPVSRHHGNRAHQSGSASERAPDG
jgi:protocatechuate 3,4-dioxygenase beta subunit